MDRRQQRMGELYGQLQGLMKELQDLKKQGGQGTFDDVTLEGSDGPVTLGQLFGDKADLIVIQNMGKHCPYCTMWADGFIGLAPHIADRAALVVASPDDPEDQMAFARERGWPFRMVSTRGTDFKKRLGFEMGDGNVMPGVSIFHRDESGAIRHVANDAFGPGDAYNGAWHFFSLFAADDPTWHPRFAYT